MDPFEDFLDDPACELQGIDLDVQLDGNDIMELDCDPDFNNFLRELANEACFPQSPRRYTCQRKSRVSLTLNAFCRILWLALTTPMDVKRRRPTRRQP